jgi:hypothetical protein
LKERAKRLPKKQKTATNSFFSFLWTKQTAFAMASLVVLFSLIGLWFFGNIGEIKPDSTDVLRQGGQNSNIPTLLSPEHNTNLTGEEILFKWQKVAEANSYVLIVSDSSMSETPPAEPE